MANDETLLREVDQELAEDRQWEMFRKNGPALIGAAAAIIIGVAGYQIYHSRKDAAAKRYALEYNNAIELLQENPEEGRTALNAVAEEGNSYRELARLQNAASYARSGERLKALELYRAIYSAGATPGPLKDFARLRAAQLSLADGRDAVLSEIGDLPQSDGPYAPLAREIVGLAALRAKDYETALGVFRDLTVDFSAPEAVRTRAEDFAALADAGKAGINVTGETQASDILEAISTGQGTDFSGDAVADGEAEEEAPVVDTDESHDDHDSGESTEEEAE